MSIVQLARDLIRLSGLTEQDVPIEFTGVRPGEKLFEELSVGSENLTKTRHPKIYIGKIAAHSRQEVLEHLSRLSGVAESNSRAQVRSSLADLVPEMREPDEGVGVAEVLEKPQASARVLHQPALNRC